MPPPGGGQAMPTYTSIPPQNEPLGSHQTAVNQAQSQSQAQAQMSVPVILPPTPTQRFTPIHLIESKVANWCAAHGASPFPMRAQGVIADRPADIPLSLLVFQDETRLSALHASPLPPPNEIEAFEDELMRQLIITNDLEQASSLDRLQIVTLYNRYRIFPTALTADQKAMVYAALCLAKHAMMRSFVVTGTPTEDSQTREDVTYFRMACECLAQWSFPSVHALCEFESSSLQYQAACSEGRDVSGFMGEQRRSRFRARQTRI